MAQQTTDLLEHFGQFSFDIKKLINEYKKDIHKNVFFINLDALRDESDVVEFNIQRWTYRPMMFCNEIYGEPNYAQVLMTVNNINSFLDFKEENFRDGLILVPPEETILRVLSYVSDILPQ